MQRGRYAIQSILKSMRFTLLWLSGLFLFFTVVAQCYGENRTENKNWMPYPFFDLEDGSKIRFELTSRLIQETEIFKSTAVIRSLVRYLPDSQKELLLEQQYSWIGPNEGVRTVGTDPFAIIAARSFDGVCCVLYGDWTSAFLSYIRIDTNTKPYSTLVIRNIGVGGSRHGNSEGTIINKYGVSFKHGTVSAQFLISDAGHVTRDGVDYNVVPIINGNEVGEHIDAAKRVWDPANSKKDAYGEGRKSGGRLNGIVSSIRGVFAGDGNGWVLPSLVALALAVGVLWAKMRKRLKQRNKGQPATLD